MKRTSHERSVFRPSYWWFHLLSTLPWLVVVALFFGSGAAGKLVVLLMGAYLIGWGFIAGALWARHSSPPALEK